MKDTEKTQVDPLCCLLGYMPCGCVVAINFEPDNQSEALYQSEGYRSNWVSRAEARTAAQAVTWPDCPHKGIAPPEPVAAQPVDASPNRICQAIHVALDSFAPPETVAALIDMVRIGRDAAQPGDGAALDGAAIKTVMDLAKSVTIAAYHNGWIARHHWVEFEKMVQNAIGEAKLPARSGGDALRARAEELEACLRGIIDNNGGHGRNFSSLKLYDWTERAQKVLNSEASK